MGLAIKKPPCCCSSLRTASLILLYFNLILNAYGLLSVISRQFENSTSSYIQALQTNDVLSIEILVEVLSCVILLVTIITIYKEKPSVNMLTAAIVILLVSIVYSGYVIISLNVNDTLKNVWEPFIEEQVANSNLRGEDKETFKRSMVDLYEPFMFLLNVLCFCDIIFVLYSALIFHSYKEELKQKPVYGLPPQQHNPDDKEANASAPYPPNAQFVNTEYPAQPNLYPGIAPNYSNQPPQCVLPTQNYPQAPPY